MRPSTDRTTLRLTMAGLAAAAVLIATGCSANDPSTSGTSTSAPPTSSNSAPSTTAAAAGVHNDADVAFAQMMISHHQQAVAMSDMILAKSGIDPDVTALATKIKAAQAPEITTMSGWLAGWGQNPSPSAGMGGMGGMGDGMMSQTDMNKLNSASGNDAARLFLTGMITHHKGAITMAETELANGENTQAKSLAQSIITSQSAEIDTMTKLLIDLR